MTELRFIEETHEYFLGLEKLPSVTRILQDVGFVNTDFFTEEAAIRGTAVHMATQYLDEGCLDWDTVAEEYLGYVDAYRKFKRDSGFKPIISEGMDYHRTMKYAGQFDLVGELNRRHVIIDKKTGVEQYWWKYQLAGYAEFPIVKSNFPGAVRHSLSLRKDGTYRLSEPYLDPMDWGVFQAALVVYRAKGMK